MKISSSFDRYKSQMRLPGIGVTGQEKLARAHVLVVGAGGLGSVVLPYLAGAGIGTIGIADEDRVALDNLHRQVMYTMADIGKPKVRQAAERLKSINPGIEVKVYPVRVTPENIDTLLAGYNLAVDCTDNAKTRYALNDACVRANVPMVYGAVYGHEGQLAVLNVDLGHRHSANYRDIFPGTDHGVDLTCDDTGVLGTLTGIIGSMQGQEVLKLFTGLGEPLINTLLCYDSLRNRLSRFEVNPSAESRNLILDQKSGTDNPHKGLSAESLHEMQPESLHLYLDHEDVTLLDVREDYQRHTPVPFRHLWLPGTTIMDRLNEITGKTVIVFCEKGIQSLKVGAHLKERVGKEKEIYSLKYGISYWNKHFSGIRITAT
jgi:sulfur-carrier protein adenylyltransferase/sulfurtransferase